MAEENPNQRCKLGRFMPTTRGWTPEDASPDRNLEKRGSGSFRATYKMSFGYYAQRLKISLDTDDIVEARQRRDVVEDTIHKISQAAEGYSIED